MEDYYALLKCTPDATPLQIKQSYQRLAREYHPDKGALSSENFLAIDKAYKILKDELSRKDYDSTTFASTCNQHSLIYAELAKEDIRLDCEGRAFYPCRCGEDFLIEKEHLEEPECVIECGECSNSILIR
ncbi:unnamed protein product [Ceutorhynchus assimilis]|uniref:Diphthamide biosynthesis protein 4 n=1 Tax=Ceutorhynchus assimilis TaxID=467358 RepID=A0A9N9MJ49_9CUCU|nr:unnamed protein product [Ceutorhynchus assimilis]